MNRSGTDPNWHGRPVPTPSQERWATVDGMRTRYLDCEPAGPTGRPPLLLIHGLLGFSFSWRFNLGALSQAARVLAVDLPGMGYSDRPPRMDHSLSGFARHLLRFLDAVQVDRADVTGTSHGGGIAMILAAAAPERVRRLVLAAPISPWSEQNRWQTRILATGPGEWLARAAWNWAEVADRRVLARMYGDPRRIAPGTVEGYAAPLAVPGTLDHLLAILRCWSSDQRQLAQALPRIAAIPTLLVWGSRDPVVLPTSADALKLQFTRAELAVLDGSGHLPYEEDPEAFNRVAGEFLARP